MKSLNQQRVEINKRIVQLEIAKMTVLYVTSMLVCALVMFIE